MISTVFFVSKSPVGSSNNSTSGSFARERAIVLRRVSGTEPRIARVHSLLLTTGQFGGLRVDKCHDIAANILRTR